MGGSRHARADVPILIFLFSVSTISQRTSRKTFSSASRLYNEACVLLVSVSTVRRFRCAKVGKTFQLPSKISIFFFLSPPPFRPRCFALFGAGCKGKKLFRTCNNLAKLFFLSLPACADRLPGNPFLLKRAAKVRRVSQPATPKEKFFFFSSPPCFTRPFQKRLLLKRGAKVRRLLTSSTTRAKFFSVSFSPAPPLSIPCPAAALPAGLVPFRTVRPGWECKGRNSFRIRKAPPPFLPTGHKGFPLFT